MTTFVLICLSVIAVCSVLMLLVILSAMEDISNYLDSIKTKMYEINAIVIDIRFYEKAKLAYKEKKIRKKHSCYDERDLK